VKWGATMDVLKKAGFVGNRGDAAALLLADLERKGDAYCIVGMTEGMPENIPSDLDIIVTPGHEKIFADQLHRFCRTHGMRFVQALRHRTGTYHVLCWRGKSGDVQFLHPDVSSGYAKNGRRFITASDLLVGRRLACDAAGTPRGFYIPAPASEFLYYLIKRIDKCSIGVREGDHLSSQWRSDPEGAARQVRRFWRGADARAILEAAKRNEWEKISVDLPRLRKKFRARGSLNFCGLWRVLERPWRRFFKPTGFWVVILGPDGVGKTSVLDHVSQNLAPAFWRKASFHLRPHLGRGKSFISSPVTDPHGARPRGLLLSTAKLFYFLFDYFFGYALRVHPKLVQSTFILFDRYFHDLLADPKRYRYGGAMWLARLVGRCVPKPDLWVLLDAPGEIVVARKGEVSLAEATRQRQAYRDVLAPFQNVARVDASQPLEAVVREVEDHILDRLEKRTRGRFGL